MKHLGIEVKVIVSIVFFVFFVTSIERYQLSSSIEEQFIESEKSRAILLVNTLSPILSLNLSLGFSEANTEYLDEVYKQNPDILRLQLKSDDNTSLYLQDKTSSTQPFIHRNFYHYKLYDAHTQEYLGRLELYMSNEKYLKVMKKNYETSIEVLIITVVLLFIFILLLKREFRPLKKLAEEIMIYEPQKNNFKAEKTQRSDEVGVIHNAVVAMVSRISHTMHLLDTLNNSLETTVKERTASLSEANRELEIYKNNLEIKVSQVIKEKQKANLLLQQQSKMASLGEMLASITHQWKQPLSIIASLNIKQKLYNEMGTLDSEQIDDTYVKIDEQVHFMTQTLRDFSDFFKPHKDMHQFFIEESVENVLNLFGKEYATKGMNICIHDSKQQAITNYENEFRQVVLNILNNARDIIVEKNPENKTLDITVSYFSDSLCVEIQDYAGGIATAVLPTIFDAYVTTKSADKGTGIGLYMSKRLIEESMSGSLDVCNKNGGACFTIALPLSVEKHDVT